jgi:hypothetical protein
MTTTASTSGTRSMKNNNNHKASLKDYTAFHGMLCGPKAARRVMQTFEGGAVVFGSQEAYDVANSGKSNVADLDVTGLRVFSLNIFSYYFLVLVSLTGCCSALGCTKVIEAIEYVDNDGDKDTPPGNTPLRFKKSDKKFIESSKTVTTVPLRLPPQAMEYVIDRSFALGPVSTKNARNEQTNMEGNTNSIAEETTIPELTLIRRFEYDFGGWFTVMMLHFLCTNGRTSLVEIYRFDTETKVGVIASTLVQTLHKIRLMLVKIRQREEPVDATKKEI